MKHTALRIALMRAQMICRKAGRALNRAIRYLIEAGLLPSDAERMARYFAGAV